MTVLGVATVVLSLVVTGLGLTAQVKKNYVRKSMDGLSPFYFFVLAISYTVWVFYGMSQHDYVLVVPMSVGTLMSWTVVLQFYMYRTKHGSEVDRKG